VTWLGMDARTESNRGISDTQVTQRLSAAVDACEKLPVLDRALQRVLTLAAREETSLAELVEALEQDPSLTTNVMRFANSAANGVRMPVRSVRQAVTMVGRTGVRRLALDSVAYRFFERAAGNGGVSRGSMHVHALLVSRLAVLCAEHAGVSTDGPHLAGLLHDCGKLVMPVAFGEDAVDEVAGSHASGCGRALAELELFGADHGQAGALLAEASGVDDEIVRAIAWHHGGETAGVCPDCTTACVQLADQVASAVAGGDLDRDLCNAALAALGLPDEVLDELAQAAGGAAVDATATPTTSLVNRVRELEVLALTDDLTGIASRRHWLEHVRAQLEAGESGGIVVLDIDAFKDVNDTFGHQIGDVVLCEVARTAAAAGFAGRLGGDELAVWVHGEPSLAVEIAEQVVRAARRHDSGGGPTVTVSAGVATTMRGDGLEVLLGRADDALYCAKREGRDRAVDGDVRSAAA